MINLQNEQEIWAALEENIANLDIVEPTTVEGIAALFPIINLSPRRNRAKWLKILVSLCEKQKIYAYKEQSYKFCKYSYVEEDGTPFYLDSDALKLIK